MTFFLSILLLDIVKARVKANGNPSGIADTDKAITAKNISFPGNPLLNNTIVIIRATIKIIKHICFENFSIRIVSGDFSSLAIVTL